MQSYRRDFQTPFGHPNVVLFASSPCRAGAEWILDYFENQIRAGVVFRSGETVQIGWMTTLLQATENGELQLLEPKFGSVPIEWTRGAENTIRQLTIQKEVCDQLVLEVCHPSMRQSAVLSPGFLSNHAEFELSRDEPEGNDSGWVFRQTNYEGSDAELCSLYQAAASVPAVIPFLALPPGALVKRRNQELDVSVGQTKISSSNNRFLERLLKSPFLS